MGKINIGGAIQSGRRFHLNGRYAKELNYTLSWAHTGEPVQYAFLRSDSWEVDDVQKKVIISHVIWKKKGGLLVPPEQGGPIYPIGKYITNNDFATITDVRWLDFVNKPEMKMTLEWRE